MLIELIGANKHMDKRCIMLKRKVTNFMNNWVRTKNKKCLVVQGARQTGKTYIIERFAEDNYEEVVKCTL